MIPLRHTQANHAARILHRLAPDDVIITVDERTKRMIVISCIDNLVKGAAGQAVQNMNLMLGFPEDEGLTDLALYP